MGTGIGLAILLFKKPQTESIHIEGSSDIHTYSNCEVTNNINTQAPQPMQFPKRVPHINNGDTANNLTSYIPGGY